jgi:hypothetical protein
VSNALKCRSVLIVVTEEAAQTLQTLRAKLARVQLPPLRDLKAFLEQPLTEEEKIPISHENFDELLGDPIDETCSEEEVAILFRRVDIGSISLLALFYLAAATSPTTPGPKEYIHSFWDENIKKILEVMLQERHSIRKSNANKLTRDPGFGLLVRNVCVFRGEELPRLHQEDARSVLVDKLAWVYQPAEYLLGG